MILFVGSYGAGISVRLGRMPQAGETMQGESLEIGHGGKSSNQAVAAARTSPAGSRVSILTALGDDAFAQQARTLWEAEGIDATGVVSTGSGTMSGVILVEESGENRIVICPGALAELSPSHLEERAELFAAASTVVVCLEIPVDTAARALELARAHGCTTILNPAPAAPLPYAAVALADYLIPNETEWEALCTAGYEAPDSQVLVRTCGAQGALISAGGLQTAVAGFPRQVVRDTTGAGDTFVGTFAAAIDSGMPLEQAAQRAVVASALSVETEQVIPAIPHADAVDAALAQYRAS